MLARTAQFTDDEVDVALELIDDALERKAASSYRVIVAHHDSVPVGYVCYGRTPMTEATFDLYWIVVEPTLRGGGVGRHLWSACEANVMLEGGRLVRIETSSTELYDGTLAFYDRIGFTEVARIRDFYRLGDDLVTYTWRRADRPER
ncbi:MAG: N-acetyltransferase [Deltaproteobacteria bacterium HGW-Deltaproteobacteria-14]|nr:MAG: N-acetyltransferase [Deltaproteobacteria bacterium HGW-Deltaproteobacteria-14]